MTKKKLAQYIVSKTGLEYKTVMQVLNLAFERILDRLRFGEHVKLENFASFKLDIKKKTNIFNFQSNRTEEVPARYKVVVDFPKHFLEFIKNKTCYDGSEKV